MYYVYVWKKPGNIPFYVGIGRTATRWNPVYARTRNPHCHRTVSQIGTSNVIIELIDGLSKESACRIEQTLIWYYGRADLGIGPLTNMTDGGDGTQNVSNESKKRMSNSAKKHSNYRADKIKGGKNPMRNPEIYAHAVTRMNAPETIAKYSGNNNPAKRPEVRAKIKAKWAEPEYKAAMIEKRKGKPIHSAESKEARKQALLDPSHPIHAFNKTLNSDPEIKAKRVAALRSPEVQAKISASLKLAWAKRKGLI
jgi:hypothetical protein